MHTKLLIDECYVWDLLQNNMAVVKEDIVMIW